jgi:hypothetical protein
MDKLKVQEIPVTSETLAIETLELLTLSLAAAMTPATVKVKLHVQVDLTNVR